MQEFDVETVPLRAKAAYWDPADPEPFLALAGTRYLRTEGETAVVTSNGAPEGTEMTVYPGWAVIRAAGSGDGQALFVTPENLQEPFGPWGPAS
jgi:hypothetical protein